MIRRTKKVALGVAALTATVPALAAVSGPVAAQGPQLRSHVSSQPRLAHHYTARAYARAIQRAPHHTVVVSGLDNPRQLAWANNGDLLVAEAGHGSYGAKGTCTAGPEGPACVGRSGKISRIGRPATASNRKPHRIARGFLSGAGKDGTFATGTDGVDQGPLGQIFTQETWFPDQFIPSGVNARQSGKLLTARNRIVADISGYEFAHNPDPETNEPRSDPYAVLALKDHQLVADAGADTILRVQGGHTSLWTVLTAGDTSKVDPVPTSLARGPKGNIYVGTLYSLAPHKARLLRYSPNGHLQHTWWGFTSITGLAVGRHGSVYVSQLFAGCPPDSQTCIPGRVTRIARDGSRHTMKVPFPAGLAVRNGHLYVSAWSIAPAKGAFGVPNSSGQVWRIG
jgi:hypothetical protein